MGIMTQDTGTGNLRGTGRRRWTENFPSKNYLTTTYIWSDKCSHFGPGCHLTATLLQWILENIKRLKHIKCLMKF
jgi:hypothetical protein